MNSELAAELIKLIKNNDYIKKQKFNTDDAKSNQSLSSIIDLELNQSQRIKMGHGVQNFLMDLIIRYSDLKDFGCGDRVVRHRANGKDQKVETDHRFIRPSNSLVYVAEIKSNLELDTEKAAETADKCLFLKQALGSKTQMFLVGARYWNTAAIPDVILSKFPVAFRPYIFGINEYLSALSIGFPFTEKEYRQIINEIAKEMFPDAPLKKLNIAIASMPKPKEDMSPKERVRDFRIPSNEVFSSSDVNELKTIASMVGLSTNARNANTIRDDLIMKRDIMMKAFFNYSEYLNQEMATVANTSATSTSAGNTSASNANTSAGNTSAIISLGAPAAYAGPSSVPTPASKPKPKGKSKSKREEASSIIEARAQVKAKKQTSVTHNEVRAPKPRSSDEVREEMEDLEMEIGEIIADAKAEGTTPDTVSENKRYDELKEEYKRAREYEKEIEDEEFEEYLREEQEEREEQERLEEQEEQERLEEQERKRWEQDRSYQRREQREQARLEGQEDDNDDE